MRVLVMCPGSFIHGGALTGLDSPERGEGRWAQNYARMLSLAGHEVYAASGGLLGAGRIEHHGVRLIDQGESTCAEYEPYDLYIDSAWWEGKEPRARARGHVILKWSLENYLREGFLPPGFCIGYPYPSHRHKFQTGANASRTFPMPTMFGEAMPEPNWAARKVFLPGKIDTSRGHEKYVEAIASFLSKHPIEGCSRSFFQEMFKGQLDFSREDSNWWETAPYNHVVGAIRRCRISFPILNPGCIIEAALRGVPSVVWEHGGFFNEVGRQLDISIPHDAPPERMVEVAEELMKSEKRHREVTRGLQDFFSCHLYERAIKYFNDMAGELL